MYIYICVCVCVFMYVCYVIIYIYSSIVLAGRVFTNGPRDRGSILGRVIPKTQKMLLDASLLNTQNYKL